MEKLRGVNVDLNKVPAQKCPECGNQFWNVAHIIKKLSALISPTGKETIIPIQVFICSKCSTVSPLFKNLNDTDEIEQSSGENLPPVFEGENAGTEKKSPSGLIL